ncbi:hypothetical protein BZG01_10870 [Labilibaculum manganireducens]|uniref:Uncharacterized protein n=1 Tax=Labilibaculum manganireducens TaxID=1940525 RepID=A0A2N3I8A4_9BACT|nr:hypothetical protein [Labilibaculum manganireducens]PKQ66519.1 hypothetical protein BZG01_10870 [Labilibaculum manganireducens]
MNSKIIVTITVVVILSIFITYKYQVASLRKERDIQMRMIAKESLIRDSILFMIAPKLAPIVSKSWSIKKRDKNKALFVIIPEEGCWACFEPKLKGLSYLEKIYSMEVIFITSDIHIRTLRIILKDELFSKNVINISSLDSEYVKSLPGKDIVFVLYDSVSQVSIPYVESKFEDPIEFIKRNYNACYLDNEKANKCYE